MENPDKEADLRHQKAKVDAGAELLVSQFFLVNEFFLKWRDRLNRGGVRVPIIPGLLLPSSAEALFRMSKLCGVSIPGSLRAKLERFANDPGALKEIGWNHRPNHCCVKESKESISMPSTAWKRYGVSVN